MSEKGYTGPDGNWHADDCAGYCCDGCGYIGPDGLWYPGPSPYPEVRRVVVTTTITDGADAHSVADLVPGENSTVWEWDDFWRDVAAGVVDAGGDRTVRAGE